MLIHLLGPLRVHNGHEVELQPRIRSVLAALALRPNEPVNASLLYEWLWDEDGYPTHPDATLHTYVSRLRSALRHSDASITTALSTYRLCADADEIDAFRFERLANVGARHNALDEERLREALELWEGPALCDVPQTRPVCTERFRLGELRLQAIEIHNEALLQRGLARQLIGDLRKLTAEFPCREQFACQLMTCLALLGRRVEALDVYQALYQRLSDDLGIQPGAESVALHLKLLRGEPLGRAEKVTLLAHQSAAGSAASGSVRSDPGRAPAVVNRHQDTTSLWLPLVRRIEAALVGSSPGTPSIAVITGPPGSGTTSVALRYAWASYDKYQGQAQFIDLTHRLDADTREGSSLAALHGRPGGSGSLLPSSPDGPATLTILDGACSARQVLAAAVGCSGHLVVTSSRRLHGLPGAREVRLHTPSIRHAAILFRRMLGVVDNDERALYATVAELCECNLLALAAVVANLSNHVYPGLAAALEALAVPPAERVAELVTGEVSVAGSFERALASCSVSEQRLACDMATRQLGWVSDQELAKASRLPRHIVRSAIHGLLEANLAQVATGAGGVTQYRLFSLCAGTIEFLGLADDSRFEAVMGSSC